VGPPESALMGRVQVLNIIGVLMMMAVVGSPPERAALGRTGAEHREYKLGRPAGLERLVGKITMVESGNRKHPHEEESNRESDGECAYAGVKRQKASQMERNERNNA
tara:strand:- start:342 stop:662 length:321 start_codon:yes stop_codon:yes gene_type:complete